jgi:hypothetical protein
MKLESIWKEAAVASQNLPGWTEKNHENFNQDSCYLDQDLNLGPPKYEERVKNKSNLGHMLSF